MTTTFQTQFNSFKGEFPLISGFLGRQTPAKQLEALKILAEDLKSDDDYTLLGRTIENQEELRVSLFSAIDCVDITELSEELDYFDGTDAFKALFQDVFGPVQVSTPTLESLADEPPADLNSAAPAEEPYSFTFNDANGFVVKGATRAEYIKNMVDTIAARRRNGQSVPDTFNGLSEDAIMLVAGSQWDNRSNANVTQARSVSSAKKTDYGIN
jgi:hypothetical protein